MLMRPIMINNHHGIIRMQGSINKFLAILLLSVLVTFFTSTVVADETPMIDRIQVVSQQISLLKNRLSQGQSELTSLQQEHDKQISQLMIEKESKSFLDKAGLDISVAKSNLDSINIELSDSQQTVSWLEKNIDEINNQLNVFSIFGVKLAKADATNVNQLRLDLSYQEKLLQLEKKRSDYLHELQNVANNILQLKREEFNHLTTLLKSNKLVLVKQQQVRDELIFQEQQNQWLEQLNVLYARLSKVDPTKSKDLYIALERDIFYTNENANYAYTQSLMARYKDQIQQMKLAVLRSNSISLLNEMEEQVQGLNKQIARLDAVYKSRLSILDKHIKYLSRKQKGDEQIQIYINKLSSLSSQYKSSALALTKLNQIMLAFRKDLDGELQNELSLRQGLPVFGLKSMMDFGKELLLVPTLSFQVSKSLYTNLLKAFQSMSYVIWVVFICLELTYLFLVFFCRRLLNQLLERPSAWHGTLSTKWLGLQWLFRNFYDLAINANILGVLYFLNIPFQNYIYIAYLALIWLIFKTMLTISRLCLVETVHHTAGRDVKLYRLLKWTILIGGVVTGITVLVHLLPLIYELKTFSDRLFLFFLMIVSLLLMRSWDVVPNLILSQMESNHPYVRKSVRLIGFLVPLLIFANSVIGLIGFLNLVMTVSWYEGIFLFVLIGYLILRGLLTDGMNQLSRLTVQYLNNGWLWNEAFLKPIDRLLRMTLFLVAGAVLFLLYGWDKQSPIVERLTRLLHYQVANVLNTTITPLNIIELLVVISIFYWTAKWTREFVYRLLLKRTTDMGIRNSIAIFSQYSVIILGGFICLRVLGIDLRALAVVAGMFAFSIGLGLRDLANNFACGFLILLERPLRVGDIVSVNGVEGDVTHIGSRAVTIRTWDHMELLVPNTEIFNKSFTNWTARDNIVRTVTNIKISRHDNPHEVKLIIQNVLSNYKEILKEPSPEVFLKEINDSVMDFEIRYYVNIRQVKSRMSVKSAVLMNIWDAFGRHGIKPPYPQQEIFIKSEIPMIEFPKNKAIEPLKSID